MGKLNSWQREAQTERQTNAAHSLLSRTYGIGTPVTVSEIQEAGQKGEISIPDMARLLTQKESEWREDRADARADAAEAREEARFDKERSVDNWTAQLVSPVLTGEKTPTQAKAELLTAVAKIGDRETRSAVISEVSRLLDTVGSLRNSSREHTRAVTDFREWSKIYKRDLRNAQLPRGMTKQQAEQQIDDWINDWLLQLAQANVAPEKIPDYMKGAEKWLDDKVNSTFPRRKVR